MWVVKLGGSLADSDALRSWLDVLASEGRGHALIVPGGGPFADQVRCAQARWRFHDRVAHHMALLAMEQYGLLLHGLSPELVLVSTEKETRGALERRRTPIWMPCAMALAAPELAQSWDITSDSLAAWLASRLAASHLVLVKSVSLNQTEVSTDWLQRNAIVDRAFAGFIRAGTFTTLLLGPSHHALLPRMLRGDVTCGTEVHPV